MNDSAAAFCRRLLRGRADELAGALERPGAAPALACVAIIVVGGGLYGASIGIWRGEWQVAFTAVKFPLLILLTCAGNALLNGCLAQLLGGGLGFRQTTLALLMSFAISALVLAAFAPVLLFLTVNVPPLGEARARDGHAAVLLAHVAAIAAAGVAGNRRLGRIVARHSSPATARVVVAAWLAGNLLLGSQFAWVLRPFIGSPGLPVQFLRDDPLRGNFFEAVARSAGQLLSP